MNTGKNTEILEKEWEGCIKNFYHAFALSDNIQVSSVHPVYGMVSFCRDWESLQEEYSKMPLSRIGGGMCAKPVPETFEEFREKVKDCYSLNLHYEEKISLFKKRDDDLEATFTCSYEEYHCFFEKICSQNN